MWAEGNVHKVPAMSTLQVKAVDILINDMKDCHLKKNSHMYLIMQSGPFYRSFNFCLIWWIFTDFLYCWVASLLTREQLECTKLWLSKKSDWLALAEQVPPKCSEVLYTLHQWEMSHRWLPICIIAQSHCARLHNSVAVNLLSVKLFASVIHPQNLQSNQFLHTLLQVIKSRKQREFFCLS